MTLKCILHASNLTRWLEILEKTHASIEYKNGYADACDDLKEYIKKMMKESI